MMLKAGAFQWTAEDMQTVAREAIRRLGNRKKPATGHNLKREIGRVVRRFLIEQLARLPAAARSAGLGKIDEQVEWFQKQVENLGK